MPPVKPPSLPSPGGYVAPKKGNAEAKFVTWAKKQGATGKVAGDIWYWSHTQPHSTVGNQDTFAYYWTSVLKTESGLSHLNKNGKVTSSGQAVGIGQISVVGGQNGTGHVGESIPWAPQLRFTLDNNVQTGLLNYAVNLRESSYALAQAVAQYGYDGAYLGGYNPTGAGNKDANSAITKTFGGRPDPASTPAAPSGGSGQYAPPGNAPVQLTTDPWVTGIRGGKLSTDPSNDPPSNVMMYDGTPLTQSSFLSLKRQLQTYYVSYTGQRPSDAQILTYIGKGWSTYSLEIALSKSAHFFKSPIWKSQAPQYKALAKDLTASGEISSKNGSLVASTPMRSLIRTAILNNWDQGTFQSVLRQQPGYVNSTEFGDRTATLLNVHQSIMGSPDQGGMDAVKQATLAGWSPTQYAAYLRSQDAYVQSPEYQTKALGFLGALGLITGQQAVLKKGQATEQNPNPSVGVLPTDKRVPAGTLTAPEDTVATYNG